FRQEHINSTLKVSAMETLKPGWPTFYKSKCYAVDMMSDAIEEDEIIIRDATTINELLTYVNLGQGKTGGESGSHDDHVTCACIAAALFKLRFNRANRRTNIEPI